jgi:hypothetical protein
VRRAKDLPTQDYVTKRTDEGKGKKEIMRCLKRYVAREIYRVPQNPRPGLLTNDSRPQRLALHLTQTAVALQLGAWTLAISRIERGATQDRVLSERCRAWLSEHRKPALDNNRCINSAAVYPRRRSKNRLTNASSAPTPSTKALIDFSTNHTGSYIGGIGPS